MSYCRWGEDGSSVYVIGAYTNLEKSSVYLWCVECEREGAVCKTAAEMLQHLQAHRERGDTVPERAFERLREEVEAVTFARCLDGHLDPHWPSSPASMRESVNDLMARRYPRRCWSRAYDVALHIGLGRFGIRCYEEGGGLEGIETWMRSCPDGYPVFLQRQSEAMFPHLCEPLHPDAGAVQEAEGLEQPEAERHDHDHVNELHDARVDGELLNPPQQDSDDHQHDQD